MAQKFTVKIGQDFLNIQYLALYVPCNPYTMINVDGCDLCQTASLLCPAHRTLNPPARRVKSPGAEISVP